MARTAIVPQDIVATGLAPTFEAANADGEKFEGTGKEYLEVINGGGSACVVTVPTPYSQDGNSLEDLVVSVGAGLTRKIGPFPARSYNVQSGADIGQVYVNFDQVVTVTVGVFKLP